MNTRYVEGYLKRLRERQDYLEQKIREKEAVSSEESSHYLKAELLALSWVIRYTEDTIIEAAEHQDKWINEGVK